MCTGRQEVHRQYIRMYTCPHWTKAARMQPCGFCLNKQRTNVIHSHSLGILGMDLVSVHCSDQYLIMLASNLALKYWSYSHPVELTTPLRKYLQKVTIVKKRKKNEIFLSVYCLVHFYPSGVYVM